MKKKLLSMLCVGAVLSTNVGTAGLISVDRTGTVISASAEATGPREYVPPLVSGDYKYYVLDDGTVEIVSYDGSDQNVIIPSTIDGKSVTCIGSSAFSNKMNITAITIPDGVTTIGQSAFSSCQFLTSINIPDTVTEIKTYAFHACIRLTSLDIPASVTSIGSAAFSVCASLNLKIDDDNPAYTVFNGDLYSKDKKTYHSCIGNKFSVTIPECVTAIGPYAFSNCHYLSSVTIPDSVKSIGDHSFLSCTSLSSINIPEGVTSIASGTFVFCRKLTEVNVPVNVKSIGRDAFQDCSGLKIVTLPDGLESIDAIAFYNCSELKTLELPESLTSIGDSAFYNCSKLTFSSFPKSLASIGVLAFDGTPWLDDALNKDHFVILNNILINGKNSSDYVIIPENVEHINSQSFCNCDKITSVDIPGNVKTIGSIAFSNCKNLNSVNIRYGVTAIDYYAFSSCDKLKTITIPRSVTSFGISIFANCTDPDFKILCYKGSAAEKYAVDNELAYELIPDTYPTNINVTYSEKYHQVRFKWDKVEGADRYGVAVYLAGKWRVHTQNITGTVYTSPKNLTPGKTYKVAIAARVNGKWDTANAIKNAVTVTIK